MSNAKQEAAKLIKQGYCKVSNHYGMVSRLDRPDWKEHMAKGHPRGLEWVDGMDLGGAEDFYRRVHSKDNLEFVDREVSALIPSSNHEVTGYRPKVD